MNRPFYFSTIFVAGICAALAQEPAARTVEVHSQDIVPIRAKVKYTTLIEVPATEKISKLLLNRGTLRFLEAGAGQTERYLEGEIKLNLPFFLKPLAVIGERVIHSEGLKILNGELPVLNRFIAQVLRA